MAAANASGDVDLIQLGAGSHVLSLGPLPTIAAEERITGAGPDVTEITGGVSAGGTLAAGALTAQGALTITGVAFRANRHGTADSTVGAVRSPSAVQR